MNNREIEEMIRNSVPGIKKDFVALKAWKEEPKDIPKYDGMAFPGICCQIAEVLVSKETFYFTADQNICSGGYGGMGLGEPMTEEQWLHAHETHQSPLTKGHKDLELARHYYEVEELKINPHPKERNTAIQVGLFRDIAEPDIVLIFCTPSAGDVINRAYCFETGKMLRGFGSQAGCSCTIRYTYVQKEPTLSIGGIEWRHYIGLEDSEITLSFPYHSLTVFMDCYPDVAERYRKYRNLIEWLRYGTPKTPPSRERVAKFSK